MSGRSLMMSLEVCRDTLKTRVSRDVKQRVSKLEEMHVLSKTKIIPGI